MSFVELAEASTFAFTFDEEVEDFIKEWRCEVDWEGYNANKTLLSL